LHHGEKYFSYNAANSKPNLSCSQFFEKFHCRSTLHEWKYHHRGLLLFKYSKKWDNIWVTKLGMRDNFSADILSATQIRGAGKNNKKVNCNTPGVPPVLPPMPNLCYPGCVFAAPPLTDPEENL